MKRSWWFLLVLGLVVSSVGLMGCGGDDDDDDPAPAAGADGADGEDGEDGEDGDDATNEVAEAAELDGTWNGTRANENGSASFTMTLVQEDDAVTGSYSDSSDFEGSVSGSIDGNDIDLTLNITGAPAPQVVPQVWSINGVVNDDRTEMDATLNNGGLGQIVEATR